MGYLALTTLVEPQAIPGTQAGQRQIFEYQEGGMPFGLGDGLALTVVCVLVKPQAISNFTNQVETSWYV